MTAETAQTREFEAEVSQLLQLMINNLYSKKEVFLRELISNASDALDRLRFAALQDEDLWEDDSELKIRVDFDEEDRTITVWDNGIGMSREDVGEDIGTIAKSGTREFIEAVQQQDDVDDTLIGQFGVGFYSSFIVADRVDVETRKAGLDPEEGVRWSSAGDGEYTIESIDRDQRGTEITLHLREDEDDLLDAHKLRGIIEKYSDHVSFPIEMRPVETGEDDEEEGEAEPEQDWEVVNRASALWTRRPNEIEEEEYEEFYKHVAHEFSDPLTWSHSPVEGRLKFTMLFYVPSQRPMDMAPGVEGDSSGVKLYVRRVFIMDDAEMFLPKYLRFIRGVIDSDDLDLNVSRETLQENRLVSAMKNTATRKVLDMLEELAEEEPDDYQTFWSEFGGIFKEGVVEDRGNRDRVAGLLRFASTHHDREEQTIGLDDYIERMEDDQEKIYYVTAESFAGAKNSPHLEIFRDKGIEVLLMYDRVDEWVVNNLEEYEGYELESVAVGDLDLEESGEGEDVSAADEEEYADLVAALRETLGERVQDVRVTNRLRDSPACLVAQEGGMSKNFERILQQAGQQVPTRKPIMEINPDHPIVERLSEKVGEESVEDWGNILFDQAWLSEGGQLDDPAGFVRRMNDKMIELLGEPSGDIITEV